MSREDQAQVTIGRGVVVVRRPRRPVRVLAVILDQEGPSEAPTRIYLDRRVHRPGQTALGEWRVSGMASSILERAAGPA